MLTILRRIALYIGLWLMARFSMCKRAKASTPALYQRKQAFMPTNGVNTSSTVAQLSTLAAIASAVFAYSQVHISFAQTNVAASQVAVARAEREEAARLEDLRFVSRVVVELDEAAHRIKVFNYSDIAIVQASLWTLGIITNAQGEGRLDTIRAPLTGLGACRTMDLPVNTVIQALPEKPQETAVSEVYLTFMAPSGLWYTVSETIVFEVVEGNPRNAIEAATHTYSDQILGDTVQEGMSEWRTTVAEIPLGPAGSVTQFASGGVNINANGCSR